VKNLIEELNGANENLLVKKTSLTYLPGHERSQILYSSILIIE